MGTPISFNSGTTATYTTGVFKRGTIGLNLANSLASNTNWWNGVDVTATQYLIYSDIYSQGQSTFAGSRPTAWTTPDLTDASLIALINTLPDRVGLPIFTTVSQATNWLNQTGKYFLIKTGYENIVTSNLTLNLDPAWYTSYPGTGTAWNDISGNYFNFTLINGVGFSTIGQGSLSFDGTDDISTGYVSNINSTAGQYNTVTFWMYWAGNSGGFPFELGGYRLWTPDTNFGFNTGNSDIYGIDGTPLINTWVHVTAVFYNGAYTGNNKLYINGVLQTLTQRVGSASSGTATAGVAIGGFQGGASVYPFQGKIGPFQIYNGELTQAQILQNFNAQSYRFGINNLISTSGLSNYWESDNQLSYAGTGTNILDLSGNNNSSTLVNGSYSSSLGAFIIDASNEAIVTPGVADGQEWTIGILLRRDGNPQGGYGRVAGTYPAIDRGEIALLNNAGQIGLNPPLSDGWLNTGVVLDTNEIAYITVYFSRTSGQSGNIKLWKNGVLVYNLTSNNADKGGITTYFIGNRSDYNGEYLPSTYWSTQIYNRQLSTTEVLQNYYQGNIVTSNLVLFLDASNIISYPTTGTVWKDLTTNGNNGTLQNGVSFSSANGGILTFDGTNDQVATNINRGNLGNTMSIDAFFRYTGNAGDGYRPIIGGNDTGSGTEFFLGKNSGNNNFGIQDGNYIYNFITDSSVFDSKWHHMCYTYENGEGKLYLDGEFKAVGSFSKCNDSEQIYIGAEVQEGYWWKGDIGKVSYYTKTLNAIEVQQNYNAQKSRFGL
jgi:hypothetical protein